MIAPYRLMFLIWFSCLFLWVTLPFQLVGREVSTYGIIIFLLFLLAFFIGTISSKNKSFISTNSIVFTKKAQRIISLVSFVSLICLLIDFDISNLNLISVAQEREVISLSLLTGGLSNSSTAFKIAFLTYPSAYVLIALSIIYSKKINYLPLFILGYLPIILSTVVMGGRNPLFYAIAITFFSIKIRSNYSEELNVYKPKSNNLSYKQTVIKFIVLSFIVIAISYFINVFISRAEMIGGTSTMFTLAESNWGVGFNGYGSKFFFDLFGEKMSFLIFITSWYIVQGLIMSATIFENFTSSAYLGSYGIEFVTAVFRRIDSYAIFKNYNKLNEFNIVGFYPSVFGSLFVDFKFIGIFIIFFWGKWCRSVYNNVKKLKLNSMLLYPFMSTGILLSFINTPFGVANGFVIYIWLFVAYYFTKYSRIN